MELVVYTKIGCPWSQEVKELLRAKKVKFVEKEVTENKIYFDELLRKAGKAQSPTVDIDGEILADTDAEEVRRVLRKKKYPGF